MTETPEQVAERIWRAYRSHGQPVWYMTHENFMKAVPSLIRTRDEAVKELERRSRTRPDYDLRCDECGAPHWLDCSLPSETWNAISNGASILCVLCIDARLKAAGLNAECEFYFVGDALSGKMYGDTTALAASQARVGELDKWLGDIQRVLEREPDNGRRIDQIHYILASVSLAAADNVVDAALEKLR